MAPCGPLQDDKNADDGFKHSPSEIYNYLRAVL